jgi:hypothetical protein
MSKMVVACEGCGETVPGHDIVHYGSIDQGYRKLCSRCFNAEVAERSGVESFENIRLEPIGITDCAGEEHQFHLRTRLLGDMVILEAFELRDGEPGGYKFKLAGNPEEDLFVLLGRLVQRIRKALSVKYLADDEYGLQIVDQTVKGVIDCDLSEVERKPLLLIDGQDISWEDFGRMLMSFEGWQFKLEIVDPSDDV